MLSTRGAATFAEAVMELTDRRGVDVVLNALAGEAIPMGLACLAEFGRFIEIGKRDIYQNSRIPLRPLRRNASFHVVAMDAVFAGDESLTREMLAEISDLVEQGALRPLPFRAFPSKQRRCGFSAHGRREAHRQSRRLVPGIICAAARRTHRTEIRNQIGWLLSHHRRVRRLRQSLGQLAGQLRRAASGALQPQRRIDAGSRSVR